MEQNQLNWIVNLIWRIADDVLRDLYVRGKQVVTHLYDQEINSEIYVICKLDLLLKGDAVDSIIGEPECPTQSNDAFPLREFDCFLENPLEEWGPELPLALGWRRDRSWPWRQPYVDHRPPVRVNPPMLLI